MHASGLCAWCVQKWAAAAAMCSRGSARERESTWKCVRVRHEAKSERVHEMAQHTLGSSWPNIPRISQSAKTSLRSPVPSSAALMTSKMVAGVTGSPSTDRSVAPSTVAPSGDVGFTACTVHVPSTNETPSGPGGTPTPTRPQLPWPRSREPFFCGRSHQIHLFCLRLPSLPYHQNPFPTPTTMTLMIPKNPSSPARGLRHPFPSL